jgi:hypothetical protein
MAEVPIAGAPTVIAASCHPVMQGWMPPLVRHRHRSGESLLHASLTWACFFIVVLTFAC